MDDPFHSKQLTIHFKEIFQAIFVFDTYLKRQIEQIRFILAELLSIILAERK